MPTIFNMYIIVTTNNVSEIKLLNKSFVKIPVTHKLFHQFVINHYCMYSAQN